MDRKQIIEKLQTIACELAQEYNCPILKRKEDRQKGIWGEDFTKQLEKMFGECTEEFNFISEEMVSLKDYKGESYQKPKNTIRFRYRFATPCLAIEYYNDNKEQIFAEIEVNDKGKISEFTIFEEKGMDLAHKLMNRWFEVRK